MKEPINGSVSQTDQDTEFADLVERVIAQIHAGQPVDLKALVAEHPDMAPRLRRLLPTLQAMAEVGQLDGSAADVRSPSPALDGTHQGILGDYKILQEIGRGGMGIVYEAQQLSLRRRVALKILPFAAVMDPRQLARFKNEAQAAATLDHPNIVSVYAVGCDRGVHYFAMQYVDGQTLAEVIHDLRQRDGIPAESRQDSATVSFLLSGKLDNGAGPVPNEQRPQRASDSAPTVRPPQAALSTEKSTNGLTYFRSVARLGIQAAEALDHAHQHGVLHRDIKPGNLMLDATGKLWVTDFGLARIEGDAGMTMTGDLLGTMRYMSPEQALAKRVVVDHRSDIYSLGATLYEMLTLHPAFTGEDRQELLRQIAFDDPKPPRTWNKAIPPDLETVVLKAMAKDPRERYATAQELADDLRRFLEDQSILARRPTLARRLTRWSRRHRAVVSTASVVAMCGLLIGASLLWRERTQTFAALEQAQQERTRADANFREAQKAVDQYFTSVSQNKLLDTPGMEPLRKELLETAVQYYQNFAKQHADDPALKAELAAAHIRLAHIYNQTGSKQWIDELRHVIDLIEPLVDQGVDVSNWTSLRDGVWFKEYRSGGYNQKDAPEVFGLCERGITVWNKLCQAHPDVPGFASDLAALYMICAVGHFGSANPNTAKPWFDEAIANWERFPNFTTGSARQLILGMAYENRARLCDAMDDRQAKYRYAARAIEVLTAPGRPEQLHEVFNNVLSDAYTSFTSGALALDRRAEAVDACRKLVAIESSSSDDCVRRARAFELLDEPDNALAEFAHAIELGPKNPNWYLRRADFHREHHRYEAALEDYTRAVELQPEGPYPRVRRAELYREQHQYDAALADYTRAIELEPKNSDLYVRRGFLHGEQHQYEAALADYNRAIELEPKNSDLYVRRGFLHEGFHHQEAAIADFNRAIELEPKNEPNYAAHAQLNFYQHRYEAAIADYTRAIEVEPNDGIWWNNRGFIRMALDGRSAAAITDFTKAIELTPKDPAPHVNRGRIHDALDRHQEAIDDFDAAIEVAPDFWMAYSARSRVYTRLERYPEALTDLNAAVDHAESDHDYWHLHLERGCLQRRMGNLAESEADFKLALERAGGPQEMASTKAELGHYDEALVDAPAGSVIRVQLLLHLRQYDRALEEATHLAVPAMKHSRRGVSLSELKRYDEAVAEFSQALDLAPDRVQDRWRRGWVASIQGRHREAHDDLEEAVRRNQYEPLAMRRLAWFLATCPDVEYRDPVRAVRLAEKAASIEPHDGVFWHTVGVARYRHGDYSEALQACQRAIEMRDLPYSPLEQLRIVTDYDRDAGFFLAMSLLQVGQEEKARKAYDAAVAWMNEHAPDDEQLRRFQREAADLLGVEASSHDAREATATPQGDN